MKRVLLILYHLFSIIFLNSDGYHLTTELLWELQSLALSFMLYVPCMRTSKLTNFLKWKMKVTKRGYSKIAFVQNLKRVLNEISIKSWIPFFTEMWILLNYEVKSHKLRQVRLRGNSKKSRFICRGFLAL